MFGVFKAVCEVVPEWLAVGNFDGEVTMKIKYSKYFIWLLLDTKNPVILGIEKRG
jgi:hypothetical protein